MSVRSTSEVVINVTAVCDNPDCGSAVITDAADKLPGLIIAEATMLWCGVEITVKDLYICKGSCAPEALASVSKHGV